MKMTRRQLEKWAKTRQMGRSRYVWLFGVAGWGTTTGLLWAFFMAWMKEWSQLPMFLALAAITFFIGGYLFGRMTWTWSEATFQRANHNK